MWESESYETATEGPWLTTTPLPGFVMYNDGSIVDAVDGKPADKCPMGDEHVWVPTPLPNIQHCVYCGQWQDMETSALVDVSLNIDLEAHLFRNGVAFSRPTRWGYGLKSFDAGVAAVWKLFPGRGSQGEHITCLVTAPLHVKHEHNWFHCVVGFTVDGYIGTTQLALLWVDRTGTDTEKAWSSITVFPPDPMGHVYTLLLRTLTQWVVAK